MTKILKNLRGDGNCVGVHKRLTLWYIAYPSFVPMRVPDGHNDGAICPRLDPIKKHRARRPCQASGLAVVQELLQLQLLHAILRHTNEVAGHVCSASARRRYDESAIHMLPMQQ